MATEIYGWAGKILRVDLTTSEVRELDTMEYADRFLGGRGIATKIYWDEVGPDVGAFDEGNCLILMSGPLGATGVQGASRFEAVSKSPMLHPEGFCYGNLGGYFAPFLKKAGYDGIVVTGKSAKPCYIYINDGQVQILDGDFLWGKGTFATRDALKKAHGQNVRFVTTGPAGENLVRTATINTDNEGSATGGFGAVMGSKNLKAIAVNGTGSPKVARPDELKKLIKESVSLSKRGGVRARLPEEHIKIVGQSSCFQCGLECMRTLYRTSSDKEAPRKCQAMWVYFPWVFKRGNESLETGFDAPGICNDLSLCTMEMSNVVQWIEDAFKADYDGIKESGLVPEDIGNRKFFDELTTMISQRTGFGDVLAEGLIRAGQKMGSDAQALFTNEVSGVGSGASYSAREYIINALIYAMEPRQPIAMLHEISRIIGQWVGNLKKPGSTPVTADVFRAAAEKFWGSDIAWDMTTERGKALASSKVIDRTIMKDCLLLCDCNWPMMATFSTPDNVGDPTLESRTFSAVTGIDTRQDELLKYGERVFNLQRAILLREGLNPETQDYPAPFNFTDPVKTVFMNPDVIVPGPGDEVVSLKGNTLDKKVYEKMKTEFYELRGWDSARGLPKSETLARLDLEDLKEDMLKSGHLA